MEILFLSNNPLESTVVDSATGNVLYNIETPFSFGYGTTTICDVHGQQVARYKPHSFGPDRVEIGGLKMDLSDWFPRAGFFTSARKFTAPNGREYLWDKIWGTRTYELIDRESGQVVARSHGSSIGLFSPKRKMGIEVSPEIAPFLDAILLSFIICEVKRHRNNAAGASAAGAGGAGAAAGAGC